MNKEIKLKLLSLAITTTITQLSFSDSYVVVADEDSKYKIVHASTIPRDNIFATVLNETTLMQETGNVLFENITLSSESSDQVKITTNISKEGLIGIWSSNQNLSFTSNDKNNLSFVTNDYDGDILLTLKIKDKYTEKYLNEIIIKNEHWVSTSPSFSSWTVDRTVSNWSPSLSTRFENELVEETRIIDRSRSVQQQELRPINNEIRYIGSPTIEKETGLTEKRTVFYGLKEYWKSIDPLVVQDWTVTDVFQDWSPFLSTRFENETVLQRREVKKERIIKTQEIRPKTGQIRQTSSNISDTSVAWENRNRQGLLEYWENVGEVTCTEWAFDRNEKWMPNASEFGRDQTVEQTRLVYDVRKCSGQQYRPATENYRVANEENEYRNEEESRTVSGTSIDLNTWGTTDPISVGDWSISQDGSYVYQEINGNPTFFNSAANNYSNSIIKGRMRVLKDPDPNGFHDDDWIGMSIGMTDANNFLLWSWRHNSTTEGHNFAKVTNKAAIDWNMHTTKEGYEVLQVKHGAAYGWNHLIYHDFEIHYTPNNVKIYVDDVKVIDVNGSFPSGQIAFFNYSQGRVEYYKITEEIVE